MIKEKLTGSFLGPCECLTTPSMLNISLFFFIEWTECLQLQVYHTVRYLSLLNGKLKFTEMVCIQILKYLELGRFEK